MRSPRTPAQRSADQPWLARGPAAVACASIEAASIARSLLEAGGNAVDAACAAAWALAVVEPAESGLGGHGVALVRDPSGRVRILDAQSRAPLGATLRSVSAADQSRGIRSTTVPSLPHLLLELQHRFGRFGIERSILPAASLAERGVDLTPLGREHLRWSVESLRECPLACHRFLRGGNLPDTGALIRQPELARTLERLAAEGAGDLVSGGTATHLLDDMAARKGLIAPEDLRAVAIIERAPIEIAWGGHRILSTPPPAGGTQLLLALRLLEVDGWCTRSQPRSISRARALRAAFRERELVPDHPDDLTDAILRWLVSEERANDIARRASIGDAGLTPDTLGEAGDTTHLCVVDGEGWWVAITQSIQSVFGAKTMCPGAGFFYNNFLKTCPRERHRYRLGPGVLARSNAAPTLVLGERAGRWEPTLIAGAAGSRRIASALAAVIDLTVAHGVALPEAVRAPRVHALLDGTVWAENPMSRVEAELLHRLLGPVERLPARAYRAGAVHAIAREDRELVAVADPRREGVALAAHAPRGVP